MTNLHQIQGLTYHCIQVIHDRTTTDNNTGTVVGHIPEGITGSYLLLHLQSDSACCVCDFSHCARFHGINVLQLLETVRFGDTINQITNPL